MMKNAKAVELEDYFSNMEKFIRGPWKFIQPQRSQDGLHCRKRTRKPSMPTV